jgi:hypothetical protein
MHGEISELIVVTVSTLLESGWTKFFAITLVVRDVAEEN